LVYYRQEFFDFPFVFGAEYLGNKLKHFPFLEMSGYYIRRFNANFEKWFDFESKHLHFDSP
jgi:hypothetical protein